MSHMTNTTSETESEVPEKQDSTFQFSETSSDPTEREIEELLQTLIEEQSKISKYIKDCSLEMKQCTICAVGVKDTVKMYNIRKNSN